MSAPAARRLFVIALVLAAAGLACAVSDLPLAPTATAPPTDPPSPTVIVAPTATPTPAPTPTPTATPLSAGLVEVPIPGGDFAAGLGDWDYTAPEYVIWQDGYVRLNAAEAPRGAAIARDLEVPAFSRVILRFRYRSQNVAAGECALEPRPGDVRVFPADNQWRAAEIDFTAEAGTTYQVGVSTLPGGACDWIHVDDFVWLAPPSEAPPTPASAAPGVTPTLGAIPAAFAFTQDFIVTADGDFPAGLPGALNDGLPSTWASLRNGRGLWQFNLGRAHTVAGLRLLAVRDRDEETTLLAIESSLDGVEWTPVYVPAGQCGATPNCAVLPQGEQVDLPFGPVDARYLRLRGGPTAFALAEVHIAIRP
jgi:hypothetical protein